MEVSLNKTTDKPTTAEGVTKKEFKKGDPFLPIPNGEYLVVADRFEEKESKAGNTYINASFKVAEGEHKGRLLWDTFMVSGSTKAVEIGKKKADELCKASGRANGFKDLHEDFSFLGSLNGRELIAKVGTQEAANGYAAKNKVIGYKSE